MVEPPDTGKEFDDPSPADMRNWLEQEIRNCTKAFELRVKEATAFVNAFESGKLSWDETSDRHAAYSDRWGEALPGTAASPGVTDEQIIDAIDKTRARRSALFPVRRGGMQFP